MKTEIVTTLLREKVTVIVRGIAADSLRKTADALLAGGVHSIEVTFDTPGAAEMIRTLKVEYADQMLVGAGTVLDTETCRTAILAGADFVLSPTLNVDVITMCGRYGKAAVPGVMTPTEILTGIEAGADIVKRLFDILASLLLIVLTSPVMLVAAIGTRLSSPGPILFRQERIGKDKKPFYMLKFRSMRVNAQSDTAWTCDHDPRRTAWGAFMRRYSIDELPQLFNVLAGDMSLVGPRPEIPRYVDHFKYSIPLYMVRHQVRPGITGWAQVNGLRGDTSIRARVDYDLYYIENWSMLFDIKILLMTPFKGVVNRQESLK